MVSRPGTAHAIIRSCLPFILSIYLFLFHSFFSRCVSYFLSLPLPLSSFAYFSVFLSLSWSSSSALLSLYVSLSVSFSLSVSLCLSLTFYSFLLFISLLLFLSFNPSPSICLPFFQSKGNIKFVTFYLIISFSFFLFHSLSFLIVFLIFCLFLLVFLPLLCIYFSLSIFLRVLPLPCSLFYSL